MIRITTASSFGRDPAVVMHGTPLEPPGFVGRVGKSLIGFLRRIFALRAGRSLSTECGETFAKLLGGASAKS